MWGRCWQGQDVFAPFTGHETSAGIAREGGRCQLPGASWRKARASPGSALGPDLPCPSRPCPPKATLIGVPVSFALLGRHRPHVTSRSWPLPPPGHCYLSLSMFSGLACWKPQRGPSQPIRRGDLTKVTALTAMHAHLVTVTSVSQPGPLLTLDACVHPAYSASRHVAQTAPWASQAATAADATLCLRSPAPAPDAGADPSRPRRLGPACPHLMGSVTKI